MPIVAYIYSGEYQKAIRDLSTALEMNLHDPAILYVNRAVAHGRDGNIDVAIDDYAEGLWLGLDLDRAISVLMDRGSYLIKKGELERAEANYRAILDLDTSVWYAAYSGFAGINLKQKDYKGAIDNFTKALSINSTNENIYYNRGYAYIKQRNWELALADIEEAIRLMPTSAYFYYKRGVVHTHLNDLHNASTDYEKSLSLDANNHYAYVGLADVHFVRGEFDLALENTQKAHELAPENSGIYASLAVIHHALGQVERAAEIWQELMAKDEHYGDAEWVKQEHTWPDPLVEEARKLIARLPK